ncbi:MAG: ribonuclease Z [Saprospiraceae bacterium]|nr:ribonuclease Z [Saprospiraceae bacterium]MCF8249616.1 ribonuclease Z [Saprospiraceae bacterium]MCF8280426.1 ribonuclease Z [Bacteroidales bacterium]MCF8310448.1 ribonuclease Z [Saprospiraceae bacterium]MCF8439826.1 ribonuclease Z [Saprospiraceae bacterium]
MRFALTILGVNAATPAFGRFPTSQVLQYHNQYFLLDCGEGAQMRMSDFNIPRHKIRQIFISHLHGDHVFGLPGLLFSFDLKGRQEPLEIFSPIGLKEMILAQLRPGGMLSFPVHFHEIDASKPMLVFENAELTVQSIPLKHGIPTVGYIFQEKPRPLNIRPEKIIEYQLSIAQIKAAKAGNTILLENGECIENQELTLPPVPLRSYAFLTDTLYDEEVLPYISGVDTLYHDTTFCNDHLENATLTLHSTASQAAELACKAGVRQLITGHYSSRYKDLEVFFEEASAIFPNTVLGLEGNTYEI